MCLSPNYLYTAILQGYVLPQLLENSYLAMSRFLWSKCVVYPFPYKFPANWNLAIPNKTNMHCTSSFFITIILERRKLLPLWFLRSYQEESLFFPSQAAVIAMLHWGTSTEPLDLSDWKRSIIKKTSATASAFPSGPVKQASHVNPGVLVSNF